MSTTIRVLILAGCLGSTLGAKAFLSSAPRVPARQPLRNFPAELGEYRQLSSSRISDSVQGVLKADDYIVRQYALPGGGAAELFIAFYEVQKAGESMHSPKNCLPGSGWSPLVNDVVVLDRDASGAPVYVNRYIIEKGSDRALVLYWYQAGGRVIASEYWGKFYLVADALRTGRRDGSIVRLIVPISSRDNQEQVTRRTLEFARALRPELPKFLPN